MGLLMLLWSCLPVASESDSLKRIMGIAACAFVILMIPELWKNRASGSMEIEASAYYSLRRVYAARMLLFGMADHNTGSLLLRRGISLLSTLLYMIC